MSFIRGLPFPLLSWDVRVRCSQARNRVPVYGGGLFVFVAIPGVAVDATCSCEASYTPIREEKFLSRPAEL